MTKTFSTGREIGIVVALTLLVSAIPAGFAFAAPTPFSLTVDEATNPSADSQSFAFTLTSHTGFSLTDTAAPYTNSTFTDGTSYDLVQTPQVSGWALTSPISCTGDTGSPVNLTQITNGVSFTAKNNKSLSCTFSNTKFPKLTVTKIVINDSGGTKVVSDFPLFIDGMSVTSGVASTTSAGLHTVSETNQTGYTGTITGDCAANGTITLAAGDVKTCTITNDDQAAHLIVIKHVINDNGGSAAASAFSTTITGVTTATPTAPGAESPGVDNTLTSVGAYSVDEGAHVGYDKTFSADCSGTIALGETKTCTITNDDIQPKLTVTKTVVNDNGGTKVVANFPLFVDGGSVTSGVQNSFSASAHTISETGDAGYTATITGDCAPNGTITLSPGDVKSCTITNDDIAPKLTITKTVVNNNGGTKVISDFPLFVDGNSVTSGVQNTSTVGLHTASETSQTGYAAGAWGGDCAANGSITLAVGDVKTCTITNDDQAPHLIVIKHVINDNGGSAVASGFSTTITGVTTAIPTAPAAESPGVDNVLTSVGAYSVDEGAHVGYDKTLSADCSGTIALGETKTCTITNDDIQPKLTVTKVVVNDNGGTKVVADFPLFVDATGVTSGVQNGFNAGAHTVSETGNSGYAGVIGGDCAANGSIALAPGDVKTCTITNDDVAPTLTVVKTVVNDNGGTKVVADFSLFIDATPVTSGATTTLASNVQYTVSETSQTGYTPSAWGGDCAANGTITLAPGQVATCTITNDDQAAHLIVIKHVVNDNGGGAAASGFSTTISSVTTATPTAPGAESPGVDNVLTSVGAYSVDEGAHVGYDKTLSADCSGTIALGETKTCTITNDDQPAHLILIKHLQNDNGGTATQDDFTPSIDQGAAVWGDNVVPAGAHTASETTLPGYTPSDWSNNCAANGSVSLAPGETKTCEITNDDIQPKFTVTKTVINHGQSKQVSDFPLSVGATQVTSGEQNGFNAGSYTVSETGDSDYAETIGGDCAPDGNITLAAGDVKSCTITNEEKPAKVVVHKIVINHGSSSDATHFAPYKVGATTVVLDAETVMDSGNYVASEATDAHYNANFTAGDCDAQGNITLVAGQTKSCTITNEEVPTHLAVTKVVINHGQNKQVSDFPLFIDGGSVTSGTNNLVNSGAHTVSETSDPDYTSTITGDCAFDGTITLTSSDNKTCTITNEEKAAKLTVHKIVTNHGQQKTEADFAPYKVDTEIVQLDLATTLDSGSHTVTEATNPDYEATFSGACDTQGNVTLHAGDNVTCTITNEEKPSKLTVTKVVVNHGGSKVVADFPLTVDGGSVTSGVENTFNSGSHTVSETPNADYTSVISGDCNAETGAVTLSPGTSKSCTITNEEKLSDITVKKVVINHGLTLDETHFAPYNVDDTPVTLDQATTFDSGSHTVSEATDLNYTQTFSEGCPAGVVTLGSDDHKTCTITNEEKPSKLTVTKVVVNHGGSKVVADFPLFVDQTGVTSGDTNTLDSGSHVVSETGSSDYTETISGDCNPQTGSVTLVAGQTKSCTITNEEKAATMRIVKTVTNDNGGQKQVSDFVLKIDDTVVTNNTPVGLDSGPHTASEVNLPGYSASVWGGDCAPDGTINLQSGQNATCTIINDDIQPKLTVTKVVVNDNGGTKVIGDFPLFVDATGVTSGVQNGFNAGAHTVSETSQASYLGTITGDCAPDGSITLLPGDVKSCTITNDDVAPTLKIVKTVVNDNGGTAVVGDFTLKIDGNTVANNTATPVSAGGHTASEVNLPGYTAGAWGGDCASDGTITLALGENKTCTITNNDNAPSLTLQKVVINDNGGSATASDWTVTATGPTGFSGSGPIVPNGASFDAGTYDLSETGPAGYTASAWVCVGGNQIDSDTIQIRLGVNVLCTITNNDNPPPIPPPPANACATPTIAPAGYTLVNGTKASDTVTLAPFTMFVGKGGNDKVTAPDGNYIICTDKGNDTITLGNGDFTIDAGNGNNIITTGNGNGYITTAQANDKITTGNGAHTINAGTGNNTIVTGDGNQIVTTGNANDKITTGGGNDVINAGGGINTVKAGGGNDTVTTGNSIDYIDGGPGIDTCNAGGGINTVVNCEL